MNVSLAPSICVAHQEACQANAWMLKERMYFLALSQRMSVLQKGCLLENINLDHDLFPWAHTAKVKFSRASWVTRAWVRCQVRWLYPSNIGAKWKEVEQLLLERERLKNTSS